MASNPATIRVTVHDFSRYIASKRDFYDSMVANGYCLPKYKSTMITEDYMRDVLGGRTFCPHYKDVKLLPSPGRRPSSCCSGSSTASARAATSSTTAASTRCASPTSGGCWTS